MLMVTIVKENINFFECIDHNVLHNQIYFLMFKFISIPISDITYYSVVYSEGNLGELLLSSAQESSLHTDSAILLLVVICSV